MTSFSVVELFAGAGGMALGMENAGLTTRLLVENDKNCVETLKENKPNWLLDSRSIVNVSFKNIEADVVSGGFPCQSFSSAGDRKGFDDIRGTLFFEFARAAAEIGYDVEYKILNSQYFNVPQKRERLVILGKRKDLKGNLTFLKESNSIITLREALKNVPASKGQKYSVYKAWVLGLIKEGNNWRTLPEDVKKEYMGASLNAGGGRTGFAKRLSWTEPCLTLTCSPSQKQTERCHPEETRPLTIREYARIQTFPDCWLFSGTISNQYKQIVLNWGNI